MCVQRKGDLPERLCSHQALRSALLSGGRWQDHCLHSSFPLRGASCSPDILKFHSSVLTGSLPLAHSRPFQTRKCGFSVLRLFFFPLMSLVISSLQHLPVSFGGIQLTGAGSSPTSPFFLSPLWSLHPFALWFFLVEFFNFLPALLFW